MPSGKKELATLRNFITISDPNSWEPLFGYLILIYFQAYKYIGDVMDSKASKDHTRTLILTCTEITN